MTMTRQDFQAIAHTFAVRMEKATTREARETLYLLAWDMADVMAASNPRFDRALFLRACGVQS